MTQRIPKSFHLFGGFCWNYFFSFIWLSLIWCFGSGFFLFAGCLFLEFFGGFFNFGNLYLYFPIHTRNFLEFAEMSFQGLGHFSALKWKMAENSLEFTWTSIKSLICRGAQLACPWPTFASHRTYASSFFFASVVTAWGCQWAQVFSLWVPLGTAMKIWTYTSKTSLSNKAWSLFLPMPALFSWTLPFFFSPPIYHISNFGAVLLTLAGT